MIDSELLIVQNLGNFCSLGKNAAFIKASCFESL